MSLTRQIAITVGDATEAGATAAAEYLQQAGWRAQLFRVEDGGGHAFETFLAKGHAAAALDYTLGDLAEARLRGDPAACTNRLTGAAKVGVPLVVVPGG